MGLVGVGWLRQNGVVWVLVCVDVWMCGCVDAVLLCVWREVGQRMQGNAASMQSTRLFLAWALFLARSLGAVPGMVPGTGDGELGSGGSRHRIASIQQITLKTLDRPPARHGSASTNARWTRSARVQPTGRPRGLQPAAGRVETGRNRLQDALGK